MDRRTASMPLPDRQRPFSTGGQTAGQTSELHAALSRRLRIVEGCSGGAANSSLKAAADAVAAAAAHAEARSPSPCSPTKSGRGGHTLRVASSSMPAEGHVPRRQQVVQAFGVHVQAPGSGYASPFGGIGGAPPQACGVVLGANAAAAASRVSSTGRCKPSAVAPPCSQQGQRFCQVQAQQGGCTGGAARGAANTPRHPGFGQPLSADRVRKYTWPRQGNSAALAASPGGAVSATPMHLTSPQEGSARNPVVRVNAPQQVQPRQLQWDEAAGSPSSGFGTCSRGFSGGGREPQPMQQPQAQSCAPSSSACSSEVGSVETRCCGSPVAELADLRRDMSVYHDLATDEKQARHEALAAQRSAEMRAEDAMLAQQRAEESNRAMEKQMGDLSARNASLESEVANCRRELHAAKTEVVEKLGDTLQRSYTELEAYQNQLQEEVVARGRMDAEFKEVLQRHKKENVALQRYRKDNESLHRQLQELRDGVMRAGGRSSTCSVQPVACGDGEVSSPSAEAVRESQPQCSEGRLRSALARGFATSTEDLREAIACVEVMLNEGKRELANRDFRDQRAAYETLHRAVASQSEEALQQALEEAHRTNVDADDIKRAEVKLEELKSVSEDDKRAQEAHQRRRKNKEQAFLLVKRDDAEALQNLLQEVENEEDTSAAGPRWRDWKDHAQRTLWRCSFELSANRVQEMLRPMLGLQAPGDEAKPKDQLGGGARKLSTPRSLDTISGQPSVQIAGSANGSAGGRADLKAASSSPERSPALNAREAEEREEQEQQPDNARDQAKLVPAVPSLFGFPVQHKATSLAPETTPEEPTPVCAEPADIVKPEQLKEDEQPKEDELFKEGGDLWKQAFRSVVKDDTGSLAEVIMDRVPRSVWEGWRNKAGKDLLTLSEERGSCAAYSMLAKALGLLKERKRETFEDREAVWVFYDGEVQPRQATVLEDTPTDAEEVFVQFWTGDEPFTRVERSLVFKASN